MKNMKKELLITVVAAFVLSFTLTGCGETAGKGDTTGKDSEPVVVATESSEVATPAPTEEPKPDARPLLDEIIEQYRTLYGDSSSNLTATAEQLKVDIYPTFAKFEAGQEDFNAWISSFNSDLDRIHAESIDLMIQYLKLMKEYHANDVTELGTDNENFCERVLNEIRVSYYDAMDALVNDYYTDYISNEVALLYGDEEAYATYGSYLEYEPHFLAINETYSQSLEDLLAKLLATRNDEALTSTYAIMVDLFFDGENSVTIIDNAIANLESQK